MERKKRGRPAKHNTAKDLEMRINAYFDDLPEGKPPTTAGLALYLGFSDRQSLYDQAGRGQDFSCALKKAITNIESFHEEQLLKNGCTGSIFWLKNHKWHDQQKLEHTGADGGPIEIDMNPAERKKRIAEIQAEITRIRS
jgi:uncharacterized protein YjhX (UPF0386 family)